MSDTDNSSSRSSDTDVEDSSTDVEESKLPTPYCFEPCESDSEGSTSTGSTCSSDDESTERLEDLSW